MFYRIMVAKYGYANVEAETEDAALHQVDEMTDEDFDWSTDYSHDDAQVVEELDSIDG